MRRRQLLSAMPALALPWVGAKADDDAPPMRYAVMSLVGNEIDVVTHVMQTGSTLDLNDHSPITLANAGFDIISLKAASEALQRCAPKAGVVLLAASMPELFVHPDALFDGKTLKLPPAVDSQVRANGNQRLLLITKYRANAEFRAKTSPVGNVSSVGGGKIEGLGFYIDETRRTYGADTGERFVGFLAPFVFIRLSLIDLASSTVLQDEFTRASTVMPNANGDHATRPWDAMSPAEKVETLRAMLTREVERAVPTLLG